MPELEPWLQSLVDRAAHEIELAIEKATAHFVHGAAYPMPRDRRALENLFLARLRSLAQANKNKAAETITARLKQTPTARKRALGALAVLDLKTGTPVAAQTRSIALPPLARMTPAAFVERLRAGNGHPLLRGRQPSGATTEFGGLELQVTEIRCVKDTREIGKDEIAIATLRPSPTRSASRPSTCAPTASSPRSTWRCWRWPRSTSADSGSF
jgi:hypothetical protein